jgi:hypothetical protein
MNRISYLNFFSLTEIIGRNVKLEMSYNTIQKIYSVNSGMESIKFPIVERLNDLRYDVVNMPDDKVILKSNYTPNSWDTMEFELYR